MLATGSQLEVPIRFFPVSDPENICEPVAVKNIGILGRNDFANVTVAIAEVRSHWWE